MEATSLGRDAFLNRLNADAHSQLELVDKIFDIPLGSTV